jgi:hypothetical protein
MMTTRVYQIKNGAFGRHDMMRKMYYRRNLVAKERKEAILKMTTIKLFSRNRVQNFVCRAMKGSCAHDSGSSRVTKFE